MSRTQMYLAGLLLVQVALILVLHSPFSGTSAGFETRALIPALAGIDPTRIEIRGAEEESIRLVRNDDAWQVDDLGGFPADGEKIRGLLQNLQDIRVRRPLVSSSRYHDAFKVTKDDNEARVLVWGADAEEMEIDLIVGSAPNFRSSYVRLAGDDAVYEARGLSAYDLRPTHRQWIDRELLQADELDVIGLTLTNPSGSFELAREDGMWKVRSPESQAEVELDQAKVGALVRQVASLRFDDATGPLDEATHGFAEPAATLILHSAGTEEQDRRFTVRIGSKVPDEESKRFATRDGFGFTGTVWESTVTPLLEETLDELSAS
jgi:hypothetical protein